MASRQSGSRCPARRTVERVVFYSRVHTLLRILHEWLLQGGPPFGALEDICKRHSVVLASEGVGGLSHELERMNGKKSIEQQASVLQTEIQRRKEIEQALLRALADWRRAERELRDFVENAIEAISWVGPDGCILWANQAELDLLGYPRDEYVGHHINEFHADTAVVEDLLARLHRNETLKNYETRLRCKNGTIRTVLINSNVMWEEGEIHPRLLLYARHHRPKTSRGRRVVLERYRGIG